MLTRLELQRYNRACLAVQLGHSYENVLPEQYKQPRVAVSVDDLLELLRMADAYLQLHPPAGYAFA